MAVTGFLGQNCAVPPLSALAARQNFGRGVAAQQLRMRNMVGGRVNSVNTGFGSFGKDAVSLDEWSLKFRKNSAVIFKRQPSMTKVLRSFETFANRSFDDTPQSPRRIESSERPL
jgi:hypothetical protein